MVGAVTRECTRDDIETVLEMARGWEAEASTYGYVAEKADELARRIGPYFPGGGSAGACRWVCLRVSPRKRRHGRPAGGRGVS